MAFLNRAVAISSIVRVILRMLRIDLRRLSSSLGLAITVWWVVVRWGSSWVAWQRRLAVGPLGHGRLGLGSRVCAIVLLAELLDAGGNFFGQAIIEILLFGQLCDDL